MSESTATARKRTRGKRARREPQVMECGSPWDVPGAHEFATLTYVVAGPEGCGRLSRVQETILAAAGQAAGSSPLPAPGFKFVGWYLDEGCGVPVSKGVNGVTGFLTPSQPLGEDGEAAPWADATYWGRFEPTEVDLRIVKALSEPAQAAREFFYSLIDDYGDAVATAQVSLPAGAVEAAVRLSGLAPGAYTVVENGTWHWRSASVRAYACAPSVDDATTVRFE